MSNTDLSTDIEIVSLNSKGLGVGRRDDGKTIFVEGALPKERVYYHSYDKKNTFETARTNFIIKASPLRSQPRCNYVSSCGGCCLQHLEAKAQSAVKARWLEDNLWHLSKLKADHIMPPLAGKAWGYRHRARLGAHVEPKSGRLQIGFRAKQSRELTALDSCAVLHPSVSALLPKMHNTFQRLSIVRKMPQIEVAVAENTIALVLRTLTPPSDNDLRLLADFARANALQIWLQPKGPDSSYCYATTNGVATTNYAPLYYRFLADREIARELTIHFLPTDFTQVNHQMNAQLVRKALQLLQPNSEDYIADLFCGIGNFSLPIALRAKKVIGIEGSKALSARASQNAKRNRLAHNTAFYSANLFEINASIAALLKDVTKMLIDPPRDGALALCRHLAESALRPQKIVYVSCNPATLARDAEILVKQAGYRLSHAGVVNMFTHTAHIESIAVFEYGCF